MKDLNFFIILGVSLLANLACGQKCHETGGCSDGLMDSYTVEYESECFEKCKADPANCKWLTYSNAGKQCSLFSKDDCKISPDMCTDCYSAQSTCTTPYVCSKAGLCQGELLGFSAQSTSQDCANACKNKIGCKWWSYKTEAKNSCNLFKKCDTQQAGNWISGQAGCTESLTTTVPPSPDVEDYYMILGGSNIATSFPTAVQVYNPSTMSAPCTLKTGLPYGLNAPSGGFVNGKAMVCGGRNSTGVIENKCYEYKVVGTTGSWAELKSIPKGVYLAGNMIENKSDFHVFGGKKSGLVKSQMYFSNNLTWTSEGISLPDTDITNGYCIVKSQDGRQVYFIGGGSLNLAKRIKVLDLEKGTYTERPEKLIGNRINAACAVGSDGKVYIAGGCCFAESKGMEVWDPTTGIVNQTHKELPQEVGQIQGLLSSRMVPIENGNKFLFFGGYVTQGSSHTLDSIVEYDIKTQQFTPKGNMESPRHDHAVIRVDKTVITSSDGCEFTPTEQPETTTVVSDPICNRENVTCDGTSKTAIADSLAKCKDECQKATPQCHFYTFNSIAVECNLFSSTECNLKEEEGSITSALECNEAFEDEVPWWSDY